MAERRDDGTAAERDRDLATWVGERGFAGAVRSDGRVVHGAAVVAADALGIDADDALLIALPLRVNARTVGVLRVAAAEPIARGVARRRFLGALAYYATLGIERLRQLNLPVAHLAGAHGAGQLDARRTADGATVFAGGLPTPSMLRPMPNATTRAIFRLGPSCCLYYNDARRFGWIRPAGPDPCRTDPFLSRLGPEPLGEDFTPAALRRALARHPRAPVKALLLDQTAIAGIGNIYADESLHAARIHPSRPAGGISPAEARRLHAAIRAILRAAADSGGTSFAGYVNEARGHAGYLGQAGVFRRQGLPCDVCGTPIIRTTVAGRATNFCPHCQQR